MLVEKGMRVMVKNPLREIIDDYFVPFGLNETMYRLQGKIVTVESVYDNWGHSLGLGDYEKIIILEDGCRYSWNRFMLEGIVLEDNKIVPIG